MTRPFVRDSETGPNLTPGNVHKIVGIKGVVRSNIDGHCLEFETLQFRVYAEQVWSRVLDRVQMNLCLFLTHG